MGNFFYRYPAEKTLWTKSFKFSVGSPVCFVYCVVRTYQWRLHSYGMWRSIFWNMGVNRSFGRVHSAHLSGRTCFSGTLVRTLHGLTSLVIFILPGNLVSRVLILWEDGSILLPWRWRQKVPQESWYLSTKLNGIPSQKEVILMLLWARHISQ